MFRLRSSTIYNPFLYAWLNENFRKEFRLILPWMFTFFRWCKSFGKPKPKKRLDVDEVNDERARFYKPEITEMSMLHKSVKSKNNEEKNGSPCTVKVSPNELIEVVHEEEENVESHSLRKNLSENVNQIESVDSRV